MPSSYADHHISTLVLCHFHNRTERQGCMLTEQAVHAAEFWLVGGNRRITCTNVLYVGSSVDPNKAWQATWRTAEHWPGCVWPFQSQQIVPEEGMLTVSIWLNLSSVCPTEQCILSTVVVHRVMWTTTVYTVFTLKDRFTNFQFLSYNNSQLPK